MIRIAFIVLLSLLATACSNYTSQTIEVFPPIELRHAALFRIDNVPITPVYFQQNWTLVVFGKGQCPADCQHRLDLIKDVSTAQRLFVIEDLADPAKMRELAKSYPGISISMGVSAASFDNFSRQFDDEEIPDRHAYIYLVSPVPELAYKLPVAALTANMIRQELDYLQ